MISICRTGDGFHSGLFINETKNIFYKEVGLDVVQKPICNYVNQARIQQQERV